ncbi:MAG: transketolase [Myxococcales bacterium]|nr:transketolase [Myxococcales bacterium]
MEDLAVNTVKTLSIDGVEAANSGHPGMPMGMADTAVVLWTRFLKFNPDDPEWPDRDRFVLSAGHGSMLLYSLLHLSGYEEMTIEQLKNFRQWGSKTAGHPEFGEAGGIETTTGPLGQGISNAVGMALAERLLAERHNRPDCSLVDHTTYVIAGDGDLMEGVASEACSLAGHLGLGKLVVLYDDNQITIDGSTDIAFTEDVKARYEAYGWQTIRVDGHDRNAVAAAIEEARSDTARPSLVMCRTHIGHGSPNKQDTSGAHGAPLGKDEIRLTKEKMNWPHEPTFYIPAEVPAFFEQAANRGRAAYADWKSRLQATDATARKSFEDQLDNTVPDSAFDHLPDFEVGTSMATRKASGATLNAICDHIPGLIGGSADLAGSNNTTLKSYGFVGPGAFDGDRRNIHFGVREHGMGAICNGMSLHGGFRPYGATFLIFSDYVRPSMRLSALMNQPVTYVLTHDSVFLGEDGPTHQPVEHAMSLRLIPNFYVVRPADAQETALSWRIALERTDGPTGLLLTRQGLPVLEGVDPTGVMRGGYVIRKEQTAGEPKVILMATGSEVHLAVAAAEQLGPDVRVVSLPCWELFNAQDQSYKDSVLLPSVKRRVAFESGRTLGWEQYIGDQGHVHGINRFGTSAPAGRIAQEWGFTTDGFVKTVRNYLDSQG